MRVGEIMQSQVLTLNPEDPLERAMYLICAHRIGGLPVVDATGRVVGILSEKDILHRMYPSFQELIEDPIRSRDFEGMEERYLDICGVRVADVMTHRVFTVTPDTPVLKAASLMLRQRVRRLPVVAAGRLVGIVSLGDIHQAIFARHFPCERPVREAARDFWAFGE